MNSSSEDSSIASQSLACDDSEDPTSGLHSAKPYEEQSCPRCRQFVMVLMTTEVELYRHYGSNCWECNREIRLADGEEFHCCTVCYYKVCYPTCETLVEQFNHK